MDKIKTDRELCQIIATSVTDIVRNSLNPTFRQTYFDTIQVRKLRPIFMIKGVLFRSLRIYLSSKNK